MIGGRLPAGVTLLADGSFSGVATTPGNYSFSVRVCDDRDPALCDDLTIEVIVPESSARLAATGASHGLLLRLVIVLIASGVALLVISRRRDRAEPSSLSAPTA